MILSCCGVLSVTGGRSVAHSFLKIMSGTGMPDFSVAAPPDTTKQKKKPQKSLQFAKA